MVEASVYEAVRIKAAARGQSISSVVTEALRRFLSAPETRPPSKVDLPLVPLGRLLVSPEVLQSNARMQEHLDNASLLEGGLDKLR